MIASAKVSYYFIKSGPSNCLFKLCFCNTTEIGSIGKLWVGYNNINLSMINEDKVPKDLQTLKSISCDTERSNIRLFSFYEDYLYFLEIISELHQPNNMDELNKRIVEDKTLLNLLKSKYWDSDFLTGKNNKVLEVKIVGKISRELILPSASSLAVYNAFSRGTCRSLSSIAKERNAHLKNILEAADIGAAETYYGYFFRKYFDSLVEKKRLVDSIHFIKQEDVLFKLIFSTLNPVQMEAAISLLVLDFGLIVDFFTANALDRIDIRARFPMDFKEEETQRFINFLKLLKLNPELIKKIETTGIISFQCKAYLASEQVGDIITVVPFADEQSSDKHIGIYNAYLAHRELGIHNGHLINWINSILRFF